VPMCFSERNGHYFSIHHSLIAFKIERCVHCAVRNESLYITGVKLSLYALNLLSVVSIKRRLEILFLVQCQIEPQNLNISAQFAVIYICIYIYIYIYIGVYIRGVTGGTDQIPKLNGLGDNGN